MLYLVHWIRRKPQRVKMTSCWLTEAHVLEVTAQGQETKLPMKPQLVFVFVFVLVQTKQTT